MKKIEFDKLNNGGKRTYNNFMVSFYELLSTKCFEEITVAEFCQFAKYPRATFYNYFDDKYELLECFWQWSFKRSIHIEYHNFKNVDELIWTLFDLSYNSLESKEESIKKIMKLNGSDAYFISSLDYFIKRKLEMLCNSTNILDSVNMPRDVVIEHISSTIFIIVKNRFIKNNKWSEEETFGYFNRLLR